MKTPEEIISIVDAVAIEPFSNPYWSKSYVIKYMESYAQQQLKAKQEEIEQCKSLANIQQKRWTERNESQQKEIEGLKMEIDRLKDDVAGYRDMAFQNKP